MTEKLLIGTYSNNRCKQGLESSVQTFEYFSQAYCNVVAGACMVIGLKFAGTASQAAFNTLVCIIGCLHTDVLFQ